MCLDENNIFLKLFVIQEKLTINFHREFILPSQEHYVD